MPAYLPSYLQFDFHVIHYSANAILCFVFAPNTDDKSILSPLDSAKNLHSPLTNERNSQPLYRNEMPPANNVPPLAAYLDVAQAYLSTTLYYCVQCTFHLLFPMPLFQLLAILNFLFDLHILEDTGCIMKDAVQHIF